MTTGNTVQEYGNIGPGNCLGSAYPERRITKTWTGGDRASPGDKTPHFYSMQLRDTSFGICKDPGGKSNPLPNCFGGGESAPRLSFSPAEENMLLDKLGEKIRGHTFNAGVFLGTQHQTLAMITHTAFRVRQGINALLRKGRTRDIVRALTTGKVDVRSGYEVTSLKPADLSDLWLEAQYGWLPLLNDVDQGVKALARNYDTYYSNRFVAQIQVQDNGFLTSTNTTTEYETRLGKRIIYNVTGTNKLEFQLTAMGLKDPASVLWELTPWSFVVDWFFPVGTFLSNLALFPSLSGTWVSTLYRRSTTKFTTSSSSFPMVRPQTQLEIDVTRTVGSSPLAVPPPSFVNPLNSSWKRAANSVALLLQMTSKRN